MCVSFSAAQLSVAFKHKDTFLGNVAVFLTAQSTVGCKPPQHYHGIHKLNNTLLVITAII